MDAKTKRGLYLVAIVAVVLSVIAGGLGVMYPLSQPAQPPGQVVQLGTTNFDSMDLTSNLSVGGNSTVTGNESVGGTLAVTGNSTFSGVVIPSSTTITPTAGQSVTPAYGLYIIGSSGAVSMTLAACTNTGQVVYFYGEDANTITINDTNIRSTDGNAITFGQYDVVELMCAETEWNHVAKSANQ